MKTVNMHSNYTASPHNFSYNSHTAIASSNDMRHKDLIKGEVHFVQKLPNNYTFPTKPHPRPQARIRSHLIPTTPISKFQMAVPFHEIKNDLIAINQNVESILSTMEHHNNFDIKTIFQIQNDLSCIFEKYTKYKVESPPKFPSEINDYIENINIIYMIKNNLLKIVKNELDIINDISNNIKIPFKILIEIKESLELINEYTIQKYYTQFSEKRNIEKSKSKIYNPAKSNKIHSTDEGQVTTKNPQKENNSYYEKFITPLIKKIKSNLDPLSINRVNTFKIFEVNKSFNM